MANELKLKWHELSPEMFPKNVQEAITKARVARQNAAILTAAADQLIQGFASRIAVEGVKLLGNDQEMVISHRFGKLTVAAAPKSEAKASKSKAALV